MVFYVQSNTIQVSQDWWIITVILLIFPFINFIYLNSFIREAIDNTGFTQIGDLRGEAYWHYSKEEAEFINKNGGNTINEGKKTSLEIRNGYGVYITNIIGFIGLGCLTILDLKQGWEGASNEQLLWWTAPILSLINFICIQTLWYSEPVYTKNRYAPPQDDL